MKTVIIKDKSDSDTEENHLNLSVPIQSGREKPNVVTLPRASQTCMNKVQTSKNQPSDAKYLFIFLPDKMFFRNI